MYIIEPITISPAMMAEQAFAVRPANDPLLVRVAQPFLVSSFTTNVPEDDYPLWNPNDTYAVGVRRMWKHRIYRAAAENTGIEPGTETEFPYKWVDAGYTNRWRMFDDKVSTATTNPESIEVSLAPGTPVDSVAFFGVDAGGVRVKAVDPYMGVVFDKEVAPVSTEGIDNWHGYFFRPIELIEDFVVTDVPMSSFGTLEVTLTKKDGIAVVGAVVMGQSFQVGEAQYGTSVGIVDFSRKERDEFGNYTIVERGFSKRAEFDVAIETRNVSKVQRVLAKHRAKPIVWLGEKSIEATVIYGPFKDFNIVISNPAFSACTITVEGLN